MTTKLILAATLALSLSAPAFAGEGNFEPNPINIGISNSGDTVQLSTLPLTGGLPAGALVGTPAYVQAQALTHWYAQQADHRFAQQQSRQSRTNG